MAIPFPDINPVAFEIPIPFAEAAWPVRWYGLAYLMGFLLGWLYMRALLHDARLWAGGPPMAPDKADDFLLWAALGTVLGGRLGFFLLYEPSLLFSNPMSFFAIWDGGMAFHGGLLGVGLAIWLFARANGVSVLSLMDLAAAATPFGLFFGRIANFINVEVYGRLTDVPWAVEFPADRLSPGDAPGPRHPTQIYEALLEGVVIFLILRWLSHSRDALKSPGLVTGAFLMAYGAFRIFAEYFKEWDESQFFTTAYFSEAMVYSVPMILLGAWFWARSRRSRAALAA